MTDETVAAALSELERATAAFRRSEKRHEQDRETLRAAIVRAFEVGARPVEIEKRSPYDRNHNARLRDAAGVPATRPGTVVSKKKATEARGQE